ncbi:MAG: glycogen debranching enzyme, partial [Acidimicrobiia bacterium]
MVADLEFDWEGDASPNTPWENTFLYETHVKGMTIRHPEVPPELRGTYKGLAADPIIDHLTELGVTAVELMPIHASATEPAVSDRGLTNYWGYSTLGFFAPDPRFASTAEPVKEFKAMVKA